MRPTCALTGSKGGPLVCLALLIVLSPASCPGATTCSQTRPPDTKSRIRELSKPTGWSADILVCPKLTCHSADTLVRTCSISADCVSRQECPRSSLSAPGFQKSSCEWLCRFNSAPVLRGNGPGARSPPDSPLPLPARQHDLFICPDSSNAQPAGPDQSPEDVADNPVAGKLCLGAGAGPDCPNRYCAAEDVFALQSQGTAGHANHCFRLPRPALAPCLLSALFSDSPACPSPCFPGAVSKCRSWPAARAGQTKPITAQSSAQTANFNFQH